MNIDDALTILGLSKIPNKNDLKAAYRNNAKLSHPDLGGSLEQMKSVNAAYELLKPIVKDEDENNKFTFKQKFDINTFKNTWCDVYMQNGFTKQESEEMIGSLLNKFV